MKALKEKRISLRSLWRMGLVVLSVFALAFAACGDSESDNSTPTPVEPGPGLGSSVVPTSFTVETYPIESRDGGWVHEGQLVSLVGIELKVRYSDNNTQTITDPSKMLVTPSIYIAGTPQMRNGDLFSGEYTLTYTENGRAVTQPLVFNNVKRIIDLDVTGQMTTQNYLIDQLPDFTGLTVYGVYSYDTSSGGDNDISHDYPEDQAPNWADQSKFYRMPIPLDIANPDYKWAWVYNATNFVEDRPGVLVSIGSYGHIESDISGHEDTTLDPADKALTGKRIEISQLYQVQTLKFNPEPTFPNNIFYDDPTLISAVQDQVALDARMAKWIEYGFAGARLDVTYTNGETKNYTLRDLQTMKNAYGVSSEGNYGYGGTWANLELFPVSYAGIRIDVTRDDKTVLAAETQGQSVIDFNWQAVGDDDYDDDADDKEGGSWTTLVGDGGWAQWAQLGAGRSRMRFYWRGKSVDFPVKIYNRPQSMSVTVKPAEVVTGTPNAVIMNGYDYVYRTPEGMAAYLNKVVISVTYAIQGGAATDVQTRPDIVAAQNNGTCRSTIDFRRQNVDGAGDPIAGDWEAYTDMRTLYSVGVFDFKGLTDYGQKLLQLQFAETNPLDFDDPDVIYNAESASVLTKANCNLYINRQRTQRGRIEYIGWAGNPDNTRTVNNTIVAVIPTGYIWDAEEPTP